MTTSAPKLRRVYSHRAALALFFAVTFMISTDALKAQGSSTRVESFALQPGGEVRVENSRGSTRVDAWEGQTVRVTAEKKGTTPVSLEPGELVLMGMGNTVVIQCKQGSSVGRIDLTMYVPRGSRLEVTGGAWPIEVSGSLAGAVIETTSGGIAYKLPSLDDARVAAQSTQGLVKSTLALADSEREGTHRLQGRIGQGSSEIILNSQSGNITLAPAPNPAAFARNANQPRNSSSAVLTSNDSKQSRVAAFDRPPLDSKEANATSGVQNDQEISQSTGVQPSRQTRGGYSASPGNGSVVFAGTDVADQSTSETKSGKLTRNRQSRDSNGGDSGMRVRITPGAIPSSGNANSSIYPEPEDQDGTSDADAGSQQSQGRQPSRTQSIPSNGSSGGGTAVFAGSGVSDDDSFSAKRGPLE